MLNSIAIPMAVTLTFGGAYVLNEWSHGEMSELMGLGHHHMADYGGYHCVAHNDTTHAAMHAQHMHENRSMPHSSCEGGRAMHGGGMGPGMMGGGG